MTYDVAFPDRLTETDELTRQDATADPSGGTRSWRFSARRRRSAVRWVRTRRR